MTLSFLLIVLIPLFLIPTFLLSRNKIRFYNIGFGMASICVFALQLWDYFVGVGLTHGLASVVRPLFSFFIDRSYLDNEEVNHLLACFAYLGIYFIVYGITYVILKIFFIGKNPDIQKKSTRFQSIFNNILYFAFTYGMLFLFLVQIRQILPLKDGFLSFVFQLIYSI